MGWGGWAQPFDAFCVLYAQWVNSAYLLLIRRPWTQSDDTKITQLVRKYGTKSWAKVSEDLDADQTIIVKRTGKQCRER